MKYVHCPAAETGIAFICCISILFAQPPAGDFFATETALPPSVLAPPETAPETDNFESSPLPPADNTAELYLSNVPNGKRSGMFQKVNFNTLWVPRYGGSNGLGMTELDLSATFALPMPKPDSPLVITPGIKTTFFDAKRGGNETLYKTGVDFRWIKPIFTGKLTADIGAGVFYSGDFKVTGSNAIRVPAHAAVLWNCNPRLNFIFGAAYLDRSDSYNVIPLMGLIWTPQENLSVELVLPRLRIAERVNWFGTGDNPVKSDWFYSAFELAGGSWVYETDGIETEADYHDLRLLLGLERKTSCGFTLGIETGYMFDRKWETYGSRVHAADSVFIRLRTAY